MRGTDDGALAVVVAGLLALATLLGAVVSLGARGVVDAEVAAIAADAASLGGVLGGEHLARLSAEANGAALVATIDDSTTTGTFTAEVRVNDHRARSTAGDRWFPTAPTLRR